MITKEQEAEILRLHHVEKWLVGTIAGQLQVHHTTVQRVLRRHGVTSEVVHPRPSIVDPYKAMIVEQLEKYPKLRASRLYEMAKERGYQGSPEHFRKVVARLRPRRSAEAYLRLRTLPGEQAQVDWAHFGKHQVGAAKRALWAFVMVLSWSRHMCLRFFWGSAMPVFLRGHVEAFESLAGVPRVILYDNLKSAVIERRGDAIRFSAQLARGTLSLRAPSRCSSAGQREGPSGAGDPLHPREFLRSSEVAGPRRPERPGCRVGGEHGRDASVPGRPHAHGAGRLRRGAKQPHLAAGGRVSVR